MKKLMLALFIGIFLIGIISAAFPSSNVKSYFTFNESSGTLGWDSYNNWNITFSTANWSAGKIGNARVTGGNSDVNLRANSSGDTAITLNFWINRTDNFATDGQLIGTNGTFDDGYWTIHAGTGASIRLGTYDAGGWGYDLADINLRLNRWDMITLILNSTSQTAYVNGVMNSTAPLSITLNSGGITAFKRSTNVFTNALVDEVGIWSSSLTPSQITDLYNGGNGITYFKVSTAELRTYLISPSNKTYISSNTVSFKSNYTYSLMNITNATYYVWNSTGALFNKTTVTVNAADNYSILNITGFILGNYHWNVQACAQNSTSVICENSLFGNYTFDWRPFVINTQTYNLNPYETSYEKFEINITTLPQILTVNSKLIYNGTQYTASTDCDSGECNIYRYIDIPLIQSGESENKSFYWTITVFDGSTSFAFNTTDFIISHNTTRIHLETCSATYPVLALNFSVWDEQNLSRINNFSFGATFNTWLGSGSIQRNQSFENSSNSKEFNICIQPNTTQHTDAIIEYKFNSSKTTYLPRNYYFQNASLTNITQHIKLYLLDASQSTSFIQEVQDQKLSPTKNALIYMQRYYPAERIYRTVQISKTDDNGESIGFYETEVADYKHIITKNGVVLLETSAQKVVGKSTPYTLTFKVGETLSTPWSFWEDNPNIQTSLIYNHTTNIVTFSYIDVTGATAYAQLLITKESSRNATIATICSTTSTQSSATLTCNMTGYEGTYVAKGIIGTNEDIVVVLRFLITTARQIFGNEGIIIGIFIIMISGFAFIWNPTAGIVAVNAALWFVSIIGFISFSPIFLFAIAAVSIIAIILLKT